MTSGYLENQKAAFVSSHHQLFRSLVLFSELDGYGGEIEDTAGL